VYWKIVKSKFEILFVLMGQTCNRPTPSPASLFPAKRCGPPVGLFSLSIAAHASGAPVLPKSRPCSPLARSYHRESRLHDIAPSQSLSPVHCPHACACGARLLASARPLAYAHHYRSTVVVAPVVGQYRSNTPGISDSSNETVTTPDSTVPKLARSTHQTHIVFRL
jgi:hypothetical protein